MKQKIISIILGIFLLSLASVSAITIQNVDTNPGEVAPGGDVEVVIEIENIFEEDVADVEVSLNLNEQIVQSLTGTTVIPGAPFSPESSSVVYVEEIDEGDEEDVKFDLVADADAKAGTYKIGVEVSYLVDGEDERETKEFTISVTINSKPELILNVEDNLMKNMKNKVEIRITNVGLTKAKLLEVELQSSGLYEILSPQRIYIGDLDSDDFDVASFEVFLKSGSTVSFPVTLKYRDATNKQFTESVTLAAKVYSRDEAIEKGLITQSRTLLYVWIVVGLIILWIVYSKIKKWRKRKKAKQGRP